MQDNHFIPTICLWSMIAMVALTVHFFGAPEADVLEGHSANGGLGLTGTVLSDDLEDEGFRITCAPEAHPF